MPQPREVSAEAKELYQYLVSVRYVEGIQIVSDLPNPKQYVLLTSELRKCHWIKGSQKPGKFELGYVVVQESLWGTQSTAEELIVSLIARYSELETNIILASFRMFASRRNRDELTPLQQLNELEYYNSFPRDVVVRSLRTYQSLSANQQYGEGYARGIIRNETQREGVNIPSQNSPPIGKVQTRKVMGRSSSAKERSTWIRSRIDQEKYASLPPAEQEEYLTSLEELYEKRNDI